MNSLSYLKEKAQNKLEDLILKVQNKFNLYLDLGNISIKYNLKSTRILGEFSPKDYSINLNQDLLKEYKDLYINEILVHELAHAVVHSMYPFGTDNRNRRVMPHGREFKLVCTYFGIRARASYREFKIKG